MNRRVHSLAVAATCAIGVADQADVGDAERVVHEHMHVFANDSGYADSILTTLTPRRPQ